MCGIAGFYDRDSSDLERLSAMAERIHHRGPDDTGTYSDQGLHLAHKRLSIIDLSGGHQPMHSSDGRFSIVFNGEIYNYMEIRAELKQDRVYQTSSDTEVLLHAYEEMGEAMLQKLNGMFAFVIYDKKERRLFAARDRLGQKPFYYIHRDSKFAFASELKALRELPWARTPLNHLALAKYLAYEYVPAPNTLYEGLYKLEPGHSLSIDLERQKIEKKCYWNTEYAEHQHLKEADILDQFEALFTQSLKYRMIADVPVGIFLSGGLDSTSCLAFLRKTFPDRELQTFSIGFDNKSFDESSYARMAAKKYETKHFEDTLNPAKLLEVLPEIQGKLDEPLADASLIPTYLLCQHASREVKVAIGGDASDELLAGYPTFLAHKYCPKGAMPKALLKTLGTLSSMLPVNMDNLSLDFKIKQTLKGMGVRNPVRNQVWLGAYNYSEISNFLHPDVWASLRLSEEQLYEELHAHWNRLSDLKSMNRLSDLYLKTYLNDDILMKVDRASMMNSLEVRAPFLDVNLVEFLNNLPFHWKLKGRNGKYILKQLVRPHVPADIIDRPKKGFGIPISHWFRGELKGHLEDRIEAAPEVINKASLRKMFVDHQDNRADNRKPLYTYFMLQPFLEELKC